MSIYFRDLAAQAAADGTISPEEILILRRAGWQDGKIDADEAEAIFAVNDRIADHSPEWTDFFVEALSEYIVNGTLPLGYVGEENADWVMAHIDRDGRLESMAELELLIKLFERATSVPESLRAYAIAQIERAVLTGEGPTRRGEALASGISDTEAQLLRRLIFAPASDRPAGVSRAEAELLFRLKAATLGAANGPEWKRLFVQGVGNYLMAYTSYEPLSRERAAELEEFISRPSDGVGRFFARMAHFDLQSGFTGVFGRKQPLRDREAAVAAAQAVTDDERSWLQAQIDADHEVDEYEQALMDFLAEEGGK
ncbi:MAG: hypothetical protein JF595_11355 [Sphingomonadales bacterium]|nr:hypothetical protein [Sphingomonadales bacterium]